MGCFPFLKLMMFIFNGIIFLGGLAVLGAGVWVKVDGGSFGKLLGAVAPQLMHVIHVGYLCIAIGTFLLLVGFLGCCGAAKESKCMLLLFFSIILILFIAEVAGAVVALAFSSLATTVKTLKEDYGKQEDITAVWDTMNCCGFQDYADFNNSYFYQKHSQQYPSPCCRLSGPCLESDVDLKNFLSRNEKIVGGVALGICVLEVRPWTWGGIWGPGAWSSGDKFSSGLRL
uniref:Tetraspanin n=1 Tax=Sphenodon punctatus TaxID=8508 RepID=A0A8D0HEN9_SPHPU